MSSVAAAFFLLSLNPILASSASAADLLVAAAADLAPAEDALAGSFEKQAGIRIRFVLHSSGMLARQIQNGAPYDVYLSANEQYVNELLRSGDLLSETVAAYATGRLGLWSADGSIKRPEDLLRKEVRHVAIANPAHAPYGLAARQALEHLKLWDKLQSKIVLAENVRQTYQYGRSGNADAIITAWTLVHSEGGIMLPEEWHDTIRQAGGVTRRSNSASSARRFMDFLLSPSGQKVLRRNGLFPVR